MQCLSLRALKTALATGGLVVLGAAAAQASPDAGEVPDNDSTTFVTTARPVVEATEAEPPVEGVTATGSTGHHETTGGLLDDVVSEVTAVVPVQVAVNVVCNDINVLGQVEDAECSAPAASGGQSTEVAGEPAAEGGSSRGLVGDVVEDVTAVLPVNVPVTVGCNNITVLGQSDAAACSVPAAGPQGRTSPTVVAPHPAPAASSVTWLVT